MKNIYAYFGVCAIQGTGSVLDLWKKSWIKQGWNPVVLGEVDAAKHPLYDQFRAKVRSFPTVNPGGFDYHAWMRWLAMANIGGFSTEPDVINYGLTDIIEPDDMTIYSVTPAMAFGTKDQYTELCKDIINHKLRVEDSYQGKPHISDQDFLAYYAEPSGRVKFDRSGVTCCDYTLHGWEIAPVVHYGTPYMAREGKMPKGAWIEKIRKI